MIEADHWIYDAIFILNGEISSLSLSDSAPLSVSELRNYIFDIDTEKLSESGKILYEKAYSFLYDEFL